MKIKLTLVSLSIMVAACLVAPLCYADNEGQWYALAGVGKASTDIPLTSIERIDDDDTAFEIGLGYAFNKTFSLEGSYLNFGEPTGFSFCPPDLVCVTLFTSEPVDVDGWSAAIRGTMPVSDNFSVFARLGLLAWDASASSPLLNDSGTDLLYSIGVASQINDRVGVQVSIDNAEADISMLKLGFTLGF
ncbi:MAG: outer membrane beta-barrel protein [Gammaproteobacteria bacterium]|nr:outer membrane beta-barrel protein [Gammaproteobacteria bacterium]